ncbi:hypothetical protein C5167_034493 [Papaver somniferum]|uniref:Uncharacterized protein n=1 Tax=Papaver somniferum TaxID=3469 RepID=A0A4Y7KH69_PAPSO|nr:hypothetical protein C5167_034493 [Papaver somniferum]
MLHCTDSIHTLASFAVQFTSYLISGNKPPAIQLHSHDSHCTCNLIHSQLCTDSNHHNGQDRNLCSNTSFPPPGCNFIYIIAPTVCNFIEPKLPELYQLNCSSVLLTSAQNPKHTSISVHSPGSTALHSAHSSTTQS